MSGDTGTNGKNGAAGGPGECGWWAMLPPRAPAPTLADDRNVDCAIVGAGVTGLAVARRLAAHRPSWNIALLDERCVGQGPAGRNSGFVMDLGHYQPGVKAESNRNLITLARLGEASLRELVNEHGIDCQWSECGRFHVAVEPIGMRKLDTFAEGLDEMGEPYVRLSADDLARSLGTSYYRAGLRVSGGAFVQPAALMRGLAESLPSNVSLFENTRVSRIVRGRPHRVEVGEATVRAEHVVLATNGAIRCLGFLRRHVIPLFTFASLTRRLTPAEQERLGGLSEWGAVPEERMGATLRRTQDGRILVRATVRYDGDGATGSLTHQEATHRRSFEARFPMLRDVPFEFTWGGKLGMTLNDTHCFGTLEEGIHAAAAYNGVGIAMGTAFGTLMADQIVGIDAPLLPAVRALPRALWTPPDPVLGLGIKAYTSWLQHRAGAEL